MGKRTLAVNPLPPWGVILLHVGACPEAILWAARRPVSARTLAECPSREWRVWLAKRLKVRTDAPWSSYVAALRAALNGDGDGEGYGYGNGEGYGNSYGNGYGDSYSYGDGYGYGNSYGNGNSYGDSYSYGNGEGYGNSYGNGNGNGDGYGYGNGEGYGDGYGADVVPLAARMTP